VKLRRHVAPDAQLGTRCSRNAWISAAVIESPSKNSASLMMNPPSVMDAGSSAACAVAGKTRVARARKAATSAAGPFTRLLEDGRLIAGICPLCRKRAEGATRGVFGAFRPLRGIRLLQFSHQYGRLGQITLRPRDIACFRF